jgi:hypothetical protein
METGFIMSHQLTFADSEFSSSAVRLKKRFSCPAWENSAMAKHGGSHQLF